jgi:muramoyltetrapeptide carboxypeptidase LdcA involved in peptidoglycan recycling
MITIQASFNWKETGILERERALIVGKSGREKNRSFTGFLEWTEVW